MITTPAPDALPRSFTVEPASAALTASASVSYLTPSAIATYLPTFTPYVPSPLSAGIKPFAHHASSSATVNVPASTASVASSDTSIAPVIVPVVLTVTVGAVYEPYLHTSNATAPSGAVMLVVPVIATLPLLFETTYVIAATSDISSVTSSSVRFA